MFIPGTHYCADVDLEEMCLENGAFEVSTNGYTGQDGLLYKGDAFMFNQNIWHRGPRNVDPDGLDRIMFILTFATAKDAPADRRRQGLGTYYYQRFNLWGSTFGMLKDATKTMVQPWPFFRAMGLVKTRGITWIHQFCQQLANGEEFYNDDELEELVKLLDEGYQLPTFLRSQSQRWKRFIPETISLWVKFLAAVNAIAVASYWILSTVVCLCQRKPVPRGLFHTFTRLVTLLGLVALPLLAFSKYIDQTDLAVSVISGEVNAKPFLAVKPTTMAKYGPTTFPERNDVLIATRFDAPFLASYNRFLDFHPGNHHWNTLLSAAAYSSLPKGLVSLLATHIVREILQYKEAGFHSRFLLQNPHTGAWSILSQAEAHRETYRAIVDKSKPVTGSLSRHLKYVLADARFGIQRDTVMARTFGGQFANHWLDVVYGEDKATESVGIESRSSQTVAPRKVVHTFPYIKADAKATDTPQTSVSRRRKTVERAALSTVDPASTLDAGNDDGDDNIRPGDKVWVYFGEGEWFPGKLVDVIDDELCLVFLYNRGMNIHVDTEDIRAYSQIKAGDRVEVEDVEGGSEEFYKGTVSHVHPDGRCTVDFDDGEVGEKVRRENLLLLLE